MLLIITEKFIPVMIVHNLLLLEKFQPPLHSGAGLTISLKELIIILIMSYLKVEFCNYPLVYLNWKSFEMSINMYSHSINRNLFIIRKTK